MRPLPNALLHMEYVFLLELALAVPVLLVFVLLRRRFGLWWDRVSASFMRIADRPVLAVILVGLTAFWGSAIIASLVQFPEPAVHDEFSYLLAADTFASGRLTNPTPACPEHFESFHILVSPSYASKYPPGQGLMLALGQVLSGLPVVGVWLGVALACAAICWMLQAWVSRGIALLTGLLTALNFGFFGYWSQNYWGGAVAALGGALVFGAMPRVVKRPRIAHAVVLGAGLFTMAISRPLEGLVVSIPVAIVLTRWMFRDRESSMRIRITRFLVPLVLVAAIGGSWIAYYNWRVTGSPTTMPYQVYQSQYDFVPQTLLAPLSPVPERCTGRFYDRQLQELGLYKAMRTLRGYGQVKWWELRHLFLFFFRFILFLPVLTVPLLWRDRRVRFAGIVIGMVLVVILAQKMTMPRKVAPAAGLVIFLIAAGLEQMSRSGVGRSLIGGIALICLLSVTVSFHPFFRWAPWPIGPERARLTLEMQAAEGKDLVVVRYAPWHSEHLEWVYNGADLEQADIVWAADLGTERNAELIKHYAGRKAWLLEADTWHKGPLKLQPYAAGVIEKNDPKPSAEM